MVFKKLLKGKKEEADVAANPEASPAAEEQVTYHADADESGGMVCTNDELLRLQQQALTQWVKSMGKRLLTGSVNLINTPFPVTIFEPRSYLEKLADVWVYPRYLTAASQATDPVERMKLVTTWFIAGLHHAFANWRKPFNPILGETWQAVLSDGTSMFMEQISHHPPVSAFHMEGPGGSYRFRGLSQPAVSIMVKYYGFKTVAKGFRYVEFPDGTRIELHYPQYIIKNVVYGSSRPRAEVDGQAILVDVRNKLKTVLNFGPLKGARNKVLRRNDAVHGFVYDCRNNQASLEEKTSTADLAVVPEEAPRVAPRHSHRTQANSAAPNGAGEPPAGSSGPVPDEDEDVFESASETEWDPEKEETDAAAALELAAKEAAEAEEADGGMEQLAGGGMAEPSTSAAALHQAVAPNGGSGDTVLPSAFAASGRIDKMSSGVTASSNSSSSSFFGGFNRMLRLSSSPNVANADPVPSEREGQALCALEGSWLGYVSFGGKRYWSVTEPHDRWRPAPNPLPSDCRFRQDLVQLAAGDLKEAQRAKEALENMQRQDKKVREAAWGGARHH